MISFVDVLKPLGKSEASIYDGLCIFCGSLLLALMAQLSIQLWFTPVPITMQTFGVMLIGALLGSKRGSLSILLYLGEGAVGLPVFAGGRGGIASLIGPTGGYLFAFVISAFVIGFLLEKGWKGNYFLTMIAFSIGSILTLGLGALWLSFYVGVENAWIMGVYPFLIGCALKILTAAFLVPSGWKLIDYLKRPTL